VSSIYIACDIRVTAGGILVTDSAQKVFACKQRPEIYGYCGNAEYPPLVLRSLVAALANGAAWPAHAAAYEEPEWVGRFLSDKLRIVPGGPDYSNTVVVRGTRKGEGSVNAEFSIFKFYVSGSVWEWARLDLPAVSDVVVAEGSGADKVRAWRDYWTSAQGRRRTSRGVFSALCGALRANADPKSGGAPQLVGMYQEGPPATFRVLFNGGRFVNGRAVPSAEAMLWHDDLFQVCDGELMKPLESAQRHRRPKGL